MTSVDKIKPSIGFVIIGRNEGLRLQACMDSVLTESPNVVYVDSNSMDDSVTQAEKRGVSVVNLDLTLPFTAARARNAGWKTLLQQHPDTEYIHFIDGDCELISGWVAQAIKFLSDSPEYSIICGQRCERFPDSSIYNALCDIEWNTPIGNAKACGGDFIIRTDALQSINGFRDDFIAGEEPEMCFRLRRAGSKIYRYDAKMTFHDAQISKFSQWWKRTKRCGYAYALGAYTHGKSAEKFKVREVARIIYSGAFLPSLLIAGIFFSKTLLIITIFMYSFQFLKIFFSISNHKVSREKQSFFLVIGKFAELSGLLGFINDKFIAKRYKLIEYK